MSSHIVKFLSVIFIISPFVTYASTGVMPCKPETGFPMVINADQLIIEASSDGTSPPGPVSRWDLSSSTWVICEGGMPNAEIPNEKYYQLKIGDGDTIRHNDREFLVIDEYVALAADVWIYNRDMMPVDSSGDFHSNYDKTPVTLDENGSLRTPLNSGRSGQIYIYISKAFVGERTFNNVKLVSLKSSIGGPDNSADTYADVYVSGVIKSDSSCKFDNDIYRINFDEMDEREIKSIADESVSYAKNINISLTCKGNITSNAVSLSLESRPDELDSRVIATNLQGLGIKTVANGKTISPVPDSLTVPRDEQRIETTGAGTEPRVATVTFVPVRTAPKIESGKLNASATLLVNFE